jgi:hypothetical protein
MHSNTEMHYAASKRAGAPNTGPIQQELLQMNASDELRLVSVLHILAIFDTHLLGSPQRLCKRFATPKTLGEVSCVLYGQYGEGV